MKIIDINQIPTTIVTEYLVESESGEIIRYTEYQDSDTLKVIDYEAEYEDPTTLDPITDEMIEAIQKLVDEELG
jgi:GH25 family lysozyme M1 (1,4-beta-N-acetylmuramidase)